VDLYIHSPIRLHGVVLSQLSTGKILSFTKTMGGCRNHGISQGGLPTRRYLVPETLDCYTGAINVVPQSPFKFPSC
jgi:hypothetical protein